MQTDTYAATKIWRTSWTADTAHYLVGWAPNNGRARCRMLRGICGKAINPGRRIDPTNIPEGVTLCESCKARA